MEKFVELHAVAATLPEANINTDVILPAVWVLNPDIDLGQKLFANRRYHPDGREIADFVLNRTPFRAARILVCGANFGCGSSREAAVWALSRFGIRCLIAASFGDIFYENCFQNGVLPVRLEPDRVASLTLALERSSDQRLHVDLRNCSIQVGDNVPQLFSLSDERRGALLEGLDTMTQLVGWRPDVVSFEKADAVARPWIYVHRG
jgi:3-isopropylmalate/(R)-2-methylmalate dehydratase small subunit